MASASCNIADTGTLRCGENDDEDDSIVTDLLEDDTCHRNFIKHSLMLKEDEDARDDSLGQRKDLSLAYKKKSWISPLNEKTDQTNNAMQPVGSLMPNKVALEDASSVVIPDGANMNY